MKQELQALLATIVAKQAEYKGKPMPQNVGEEIDALATQAAELQGKLEVEGAREAKIAKLREFGGKLVDAPLPGDAQPEPTKTDAIVGYLSAGELVAASDGLKDFLAAGLPKTGHVLASIVSPFAKKAIRGGLIPLTGKMLAEVKAASPTIGANVLPPEYLSDIVRVPERDKLVLRDVLSIGSTSANAVRYLEQVYTRGAAAVAQGAEKPDASISFESKLAAVRKIAVWMPVDDEQLADFAELARIINEELLYDLAKHTEELVMYGSGSGEEFEGICVNANVPVARTEGGDTLIDTFRRAITDVRVAGYEPNAGVVHPLDWESIVLEKGSDNRYVWVVVTDGNVQRLWGVPVIESVAMADFQGNDTEERNLLVGDFRRGATLWDREMANVSTGWIANQFIENKRTILAELRAAFAVRRPRAFVKHTTQEAVVS